MENTLVQERKEKMKLSKVDVFNILGGVHISYEIDNALRAIYHNRSHPIYRKFTSFAILVNLKHLNSNLNSRST